MSDYQQKLQSFDEMIKAGELSEVQRQLKEISYSEIPREEKWRFSEVARRVNMHSWSISLLNPIIRSEIALVEPPQPKEIVNYGASLVRFGSYKEGFDLLEKVDAKEYPEALLFRTLGLINQWKYKDCIPLMKQYVKNDRLSSYQKMVGRYNLAAAYAFEGKSAQAIELAEEIIDYSQSEDWVFLMANAYRVMAQIAFNSLNLSEARKFNLKSLEAFAGKNNLYNFFSKKLNTFIDMYEDGFSRRSKAQLKEVKEEAKFRRHYETLRECDLYQALIVKDFELLERLYFGTPYSDYRRRIKKLIGMEFRPGAEFTYSSLGLAKDSQIPFDLSTGESVDGSYFLEPFSVLHRCLVVLVEDFYRPVSLGVLFSKLYPNEFFDPLTSPNRVQTTLQRLKKWFLENRISASVLSAKDQFQFVNSDERFVIRIYLRSPHRGKDSLHLAKLKAHFQHKAFSSGNAQKVLEVSNSSALRVLREAVRKNELIKVGTGRATLYRF